MKAPRPRAPPSSFAAVVTGDHDFASLPGRQFDFYDNPNTVKQQPGQLPPLTEDALKHLRFAASIVGRAAPQRSEPSMPHQEMNHHADIVATVTGVSHYIDHKRWQELRRLYASRVRTDYTSLFGGAPQEQAGDALIEAWRKLLAPIVTQHLLGPIAVELDGAKATAHCHVRGYHYARGTPGGDEWMVAGHYVFELVEEGDAWRIRGMTLETFYQNGNLKLLELAGGK